MGAVSGLGDSYDLPNYVGELFNITPNDTPFLSAIGGMTGGKSVTSKQFTWQTVDNAAAAQTVVVEGADATFAERSRSEVTNVTQIMQYGVHVSYTKQAATGNKSGESILGNQPVQGREVLALREPASRWVDGVGACAWRRGFSAMARRGDGVPAMAWRSTVRHRAGGHATDAPGHQANVAATAQTRGKKQGRRERASCPAPRRPGRSRASPPSRGRRSRRPAD